MNEFLAEHGIAEHLAVVTCTDVLSGARPVVYVTRADGDWQFLCGEAHEDRAGTIQVVGIVHLIASDPTLADVLDLNVEEDADRTTVGGEWTRKQY